MIGQLLPQDFTPDELLLIQRIRACKNYYHILGVRRNSTEREIRVSYKRIALRIHPDKSKAPGAEDAFKIVTNAVATLCDRETRRRYDVALIRQRARQRVFDNIADPWLVNILIDMLSDMHIRVNRDDELSDTDSEWETDSDQSHSDPDLNFLASDTDSDTDSAQSDDEYLQREWETMHGAALIMFALSSAISYMVYSVLMNIIRLLITLDIL